MSRVGKMPVAIPQGVDVTIDDDQISVKGSLGTLVRPVERAGHGQERRRQADVRAGQRLAAKPTRCAARCARWSTNMVGGVTQGLREEAQPGRRRLSCPGRRAPS